MKQDFTATPGNSLLYKSLPNATPINGVVIDNPTGGWLYLVSENQWVPPYTNGWSMPLTYAQTSVNVEYRSVGPAGQISTQQGTVDSPWRLELNSESVESDAGGPTSQFVEQFTPLIKLGTYNNVPISTGFTSTAWVAGIANKRIRVWSLSASIDLLTSQSTGLLVVAWVDDSAAQEVFAGFVGHDLPPLSVVFSQGYDLTVGGNLKLSALPGTFCDHTLRAEVTYSVI